MKTKIKDFSTEELKQELYERETQEEINRLNSLGEPVEYFFDIGGDERRTDYGIILVFDHEVEGSHKSFGNNEWHMHAMKHRYVHNQDELVTYFNRYSEYFKRFKKRGKNHQWIMGLKH